jgi:hypothetical protein
MKCAECGEYNTVIDIAKGYCWRCEIELDDES